MGRRANGWLSAAALLVSACSAPLLQQEARPAPVFREGRMTAVLASQAILVGSSTKSQVAERLGPGETLRFESGHEVWVYRARDPQARNRSEELAVLFDPAGVVSKVRVKPGVQQGVVR